MSQLKELFDAAGLPGYMYGALTRYIDYGLSPGGFLSAMLAGDTADGARRADVQNARVLPEWTGFIHDHLPTDAIGSWENYRAWCKHGGLEGLGGIQ